MLLDNLLKEGFKQSTFDPYHFLRDDMTILTYLNDYLIFVSLNASIDRLLSNLKEPFKLVGEKEDIKAHLELKGKKAREITITRTYTALLYRILQ